LKYLTYTCTIQRAFDTQLLEKETTLERVLTIEEIEQIFPCPANNEDRITLPDMRIESKAQDFRDEKPGTFLFFQHLRKAGGTNFCSLAENNLPKKAQPRYYCMPDMGWSGNKNAGYCKFSICCTFGVNIFGIYVTHLLVKSKYILGPTKKLLVE